MKNYHFAIMLFFCVFYITAVTNEDMKQKLTVLPEITSVTAADVSIADNDNSSTVQLGLTDKTPVISEEIAAFAKINISSIDYLFFGPYVNFDGDLKFKKEDDDKDTVYFYLNKINGKLDSGFKIGIEKTKKDLKGSSVYLSIPFTAVFLANKYDSKIERLSSVNETDFFTYFYAGSGIGVNAELESDDYNIDTSFSDQFTFGFEPIVPSYRNAPSSYIKNEIELSFFIAPFNFISDKVNLFTGFKEKFTFEKMYYNRTFSNKFYLSLYWKPVKGFKFTVNPMIYRYEVSALHSTGSLYGQEQKVSGEVEIEISSKNIGAAFSIEPTFWAMKKDQVNADELKDITFKVALEIK